MRACVLAQRAACRLIRAEHCQSCLMLALSPGTRTLEAGVCAARGALFCCLPLSCSAIGSQVLLAMLGAYRQPVWQVCIFWLTMWRRSFLLKLAFGLCRPRRDHHHPCPAQRDMEIDLLQCLCHWQFGRQCAWRWPSSQPCASAVGSGISSTFSSRIELAVHLAKLS